MYKATKLITTTIVFLVILQNRKLKKTTQDTSVGFGVVFIIYKHQDTVMRGLVFRVLWKNSQRPHLPHGFFLFFPKLFVENALPQYKKNIVKRITL